MNKAILLASTALLSACSLAPEFKLPDMKTPAAFKEQPSKADAAVPANIWKPAQPLEQADRGQWWKIFGDQQLNALEQQAIDANQSLKASAERVNQARATVRANAISFLPDISIGANAVRAQPSSAGVAAFGGPTGTQLSPYTLYSAQGVATYELDLFGRVRDNERALTYTADAQEALYRSMLLTLQADVAQHYFTLRALDTERKLLKDTVGIRSEAQRIMQKRFDVGTSGEPDLARAKSELAATQAELTSLDRKRAALEHALAVLLGQMPSEFSFPEAPLDTQPPEIPGGVPSTVLLRRPDIAAAQAAMASANARIGVARTAFFPIVALTASGGYESTTLGDLFMWSNRTWALGQLAGSAISMTLFDSGRNLARLDAADAAYEESVANYKQQVLVAFRDVEDTLAEQRLLALQSMQTEAASAAMKRATELTQKRYDEGDVSYFEVVDAQRNSLAAERGAVQTRGQRLIATVGLIRALGGGWDKVSMPVPAPAPELLQSFDTVVPQPAPALVAPPPAPQAAPEAEEDDQPFVPGFDF